MLTILSKTINRNESFDTMWRDMIFLIIIFLIILFLAYYVTKLIAGAKLKSMKNNNMEIIESISIGFNQVHIIKVNKQYFLISNSKDGVRMLSEIKEEGLITNQNIPKIPFDKYFKLNMKKGENNDK